MAVLEEITLVIRKDVTRMDESSLVTLIASIIGVVGTLLGTILGWILSGLSRKGKIIAYIISFGVIPWKSSGKFTEDKADITFPNEADYFEIGLDLELYNTSIENNIIRDVKITIYDKKNALLHTYLRVSDNGRLLLEPLNLEGKTIIFLTLEAKILDTSMILASNKISLCFEDGHRKKYKCILAKYKDISKEKIIQVGGYCPSSLPG